MDALGRTWSRRPDGLLETPASVEVLELDLLPFELGAAFVAGGFLLRCLLGHASVTDIDVFVADVEAGRSVARLLNEHGWSLQRASRGSNGFEGDPEGTGHWYALDEAFAVDLVPIPMSVVDRLASFDITVCQVAFDGRVLIATPAALEDLEARRLRVTRVTRPERVRRYLARGFLPDPIGLVDVLQRDNDVPGWTSSTLTRAEALGRTPKGVA